MRVSYKKFKNKKWINTTANRVNSKRAFIFIHRDGKKMLYLDKNDYEVNVMDEKINSEL